jgi:hypothetical protein
MEEQNVKPREPELEDEQQEAAPEPKGSIVATFAAAFAGVLVGVIPIAIWAYLTNYTGRVLYVVIPIVIGLFIVLMGGCRDRRGVVITAVFSYVGAMWGGVVAYTAHKAYVSGYSPALIYPMSFDMIGTSKVISGISFSSDYVFPALFVLIGIIAAWMIFKSGFKRTKTEK